MKSALVNEFAPFPTSWLEPAPGKKQACSNRAARGLIGLRSGTDLALVDECGPFPTSWLEPVPGRSSPAGRGEMDSRELCHTQFCFSDELCALYLLTGACA